MFCFVKKKISSQHFLIHKYSFNEVMSAKVNFIVVFSYSLIYLETDLFVKHKKWI